MKQIGLVILLLISIGMASAQTYSIGDIYIAPDGSQGIVYYIFPDGTGGWVVALTDASEGCAWGNNVDVPQLTNCTTNYTDWYMNYPDGYANTQILRNFHNNNEYASGVVDFANGWVLPTLRQMRTLCSNLAFVSTPLLNAGGTELSEVPYWCCMEYSADKAWGVNLMHGGNMSYDNKSELYHVRAVRSFSYLSDNLSSEYSFVWSTGATTPSITVSPQQTTTYTVTVTEVGTTNTGSGEKTIGVLPSPQATVTATAEAVCVGDEVTLEATALNPEELVTPLPVAIGDILCTDGSLVGVSDWPVAGKTAWGVVFHVDNTGTHGWAVHLQDQGLSMQWSPVGQFSDVPTLANFSEPRNAITDLNGYNNTQNLRNSGDATQYPAAYAVDIDNGWYLPSLGQLRLLFSEFVTLNASLQAVGGTQFPMNNYYFYWSSTEAASNTAWCIEHSGNLNNYSKNATHRVRSVRNF